MTEPDDTAVTLMRMALALLERAGRADPAARLRHAIDAAEREAASQRTDDHRC